MMMSNKDLALHSTLNDNEERIPPDPESIQNQEVDKDSMDILEDALVICKFGKFHIKLMLATFAAYSGVILANSSTAFMLPRADCDLRMDNVQKGLLATFPYFGMIGSTLFVSFLTDNFGRKVFVVYGLLGLFVDRVIQGSSQTYQVLLIAKFFEGILFSICFPVPIVILSESIHKNVRQKALLICATFLPIHCIILSLIAWAILPQDWDFIIIKGVFEIHSWSIFFYACSLWGLIGGVMYMSLPESPKYLLTHGQEDKALEVLRHIYSVNTGNDKNTFPITTLKSNKNLNTLTGTSKISFKKRITQGVLEMKMILKKPYFGRLVYYTLLLCTTLFVTNTLRAWWPQISTVVENYEKTNNKSERFCYIITQYTDSLKEIKISQNVSHLLNETEVCKPNISGSYTYINGIILGCIGLVGNLLTATLVDIVNIKLLMFLLCLTPSCLLAGLFWTTSSFQIGMLQAAASGITTTCFSIQMSLVVRAFPTTFRALALSVVLFFGRVLTILGGTAFPIMLNTGCMVPYIVLSAMMLFIACLAFFIPNTKKGDQ